MPWLRRARLWSSLVRVRLAWLILLVALAACEDSSPRLSPLPDQALVLAFGDSLTAGQGAKTEQAYPAVLEGLIGHRVIASGVPGEVSAAGLRRLKGVLDRYQPDLIIICHGGNDLLRRMPRSALRKNLAAMVKLAREEGAEVLLVGVPKPGLLLTGAADLYEAVAEDLAVPFEGEVLAEILDSPTMKSDLIHPNANGYRRMAEAIAEKLKASGAL